MPLEYNCLISQMSFWILAWQLIFLSPVLISRFFQWYPEFLIQALTLQVLTALKKLILRVLLITEFITLQMGEELEEAEWILVPGAEAE